MAEGIDQWVNSMARLEFLAIALLSVATARSHTSVPEKFSFATKHKVGDEMRWDQRARLLSTYLPVGLDTTLRERVTEVGPDGSYVVQVTQGKMTVHWAGQELASPNEPTTATYRCAPDGDLLEASAETFDNGWFVRSHDLEVPILPSTPVSLGDSWTHAFAANPKTGAVAAHGAYRLEGVIKEGAQSMFVIRFTVQETEGVAPASCSGQVAYRMSDSTPRSFDLKLKDAAVPGIPGLASGTLVRTSR